ncbi:hypothetical protein BS78_01G256600 [Paspalum vaginatum]|nr:hypothetical protein BS78_01G256600 [Paspalum vaginatum]
MPSPRGPRVWRPRLTGAGRLPASACARSRAQGARSPGQAERRCVDGCHCSTDPRPVAACRCRLFCPPPSVLLAKPPRLQYPGVLHHHPDSNFHHGRLVYNSASSEPEILPDTGVLGPFLDRPRPFARLSHGVRRRHCSPVAATLSISSSLPMPALKQHQKAQDMSLGVVANSETPPRTYAFSFIN